MADFLHHRGDLVMDILIELGDVLVVFKAVQANQQAEQRHGGVAQRAPGQAT
ncbi:hypothetical protein D3C85_1685410 [compost metagenome]